MKLPSFQSRLLFCLALTGFAHAGVTSGHASDPGPDWWAAQRQVTSRLMDGDASLVDLVRAQDKAPSNSPQDTIFKLNIYMRAGMDEEAIETLQELKKQAPDLRNHEISGIYYSACDNHGAWEVATALVSIFAENISELSLDNRLFKHLLDSGWSVEKVDAWLAEKAPGRDHFWERERLRFNVKHKLLQALLSELEAQVRKEPMDIEGVIAYLETLYQSGLGREQMPDLSWMPGTVKPASAFDGGELASGLAKVGAFAAAIPFYERAIGMVLTDEDLRQRMAIPQRVVSDDMRRHGHAVHLREGLANCFLELNRGDDAQKWMLEAADIRKEHGLGDHSLLAGQVQAMSGERVIEDRILENEKLDEDDPRYWLERARYYQGREEATEEEIALQKGLALTYPQPVPEHRGKGHVDDRSDLLMAYGRFLKRQKRDSDAADLLREELKEAPAESSSAERAADMLSVDFSAELMVDDEVLWSWLEQRPLWSHTEERLLARTLEKAPKEEVTPHLIRAEKLTHDADASRSAVLGWVENRMGFAARSIPLLEAAMKNSTDKELLERAGFTLFGSYLDIGDWRKADAIFPQAAVRLSAHEIPAWYAKIAVKAAKSGANEDALRIWKRAANLDLTEIGRLEEMVKAGMTAELLAFYQHLGEELPSSRIPPLAITMLPSADNTGR